MAKGLGRLLTAMVTPMRADASVDYAAAATLAARLVESGSDGVVVCGTTGESPTLTDEEKVGLFEAVVEAIGGRATVVAGTGTYDTHHSIELTRRAEKVGVDAILAVVPYYNRPPQEGLFRHFEAIAKATSLPVILYNIPGRTGQHLTAETTARLAAISNVVALKDSTGQIDHVSQVRRLVPPEFLIYSGDDSLTLPILSVGGDGVISVASHLVGRRIRDMIDAFLAGNVQGARQIHLEMFGLFRALFVTTNPIPVKRALKLAGIDVGPVRPPLVEASEAETKVIRDAMAELGLVA
ncbi:MAG: 4-hydroxy-tetrahydrodipicolinate synthase [Firmicutes bacterium]|uniref:4-hydroxy-tetrahydrodipicolinate synthase n=1 Tax=Geochorda subterranea TaxID=3109564 RepID=A0ABZ1BKW9_9FIRM|nr:4-hydroxy-tetrahydrodipicolinate synthase [Limnochorda sp. LNt]NLG68949.1 4-hydroxy-tetrahydrodipicolinate synthase [Bacillota bacterium]WRP13429.1 4-hydroxy-tetrahydrodipicolinate synthase [Limnochorda sp. LNt]